MERHRDPKHSRRTTAWAREESHIKSINAHPSYDEEDFVQETPEAALVAPQAYLLTTQAKPGDPQEHMHQAAIRSLRLVEDRLRKHIPEKRRHIIRKRERKGLSANLRKTKQASHQATKSAKHERRTRGIL
jgi:hypothetical protein